LTIFGKKFIIIQLGEEVSVFSNYALLLEMGAPPRRFDYKGAFFPSIKNRGFVQIYKPF